jgi:hypothetical protein
VPVVPEPLGGEAMDQLGGLAALREGERAQPPFDEHGLEARGFGERRAAHGELGIDQRRVPEHDGAFGARRRIVADHGDALAEQRRAELAGVRDGCRCEDELRLGAVDPGEAPQAPQHVRDMRAEDSAVDVRLVDDHVAQVRQYVTPAVVVRQQADVDHVRVREDQVRPRADLPALLDRRVAVVDRRLEPRDPVARERLELVLRERFRRVEVERAALGLPRELIEHRQVERESLARCRPGRDDDVLTARSRVPYLALVRVEPRHTDRIAHPLIEAVRQVGEPRLAFRLGAEVGDLLALEEPFPAEDVDAHGFSQAEARPS